jgi:DNA-binding HxlR family transcriptional regulator
MGSSIGFLAYSAFTRPMKAAQETSMSAKDTAAMVQLLDLLESRYAIRVVWALSDGHPQTFRLLQDSVGGVTPNTLNTRLKELRAAKLVDHGGDGYRLTSQGADLARRLTEVQRFASKWSQQLARSNAAVAAASRTSAPRLGA